MLADVTCCRMRRVHLQVLTHSLSLALTCCRMRRVHLQAASDKHAILHAHPQTHAAFADAYSLRRRIQPTQTHTAYADAYSTHTCGQRQHT
jgi:hypothetical protein